MSRPAADRDPIEVRIALADAAATEALGRALGERLAPGDALALLGDLGAGKTTLARGVAHGLGVDDPDEVASPTWLLVIEHEGPVPMLHLDAYLGDKTRNFLLDGGLDYVGEAGGVLVVEWADRIRDLLPARTVTVELAPAPTGGRIALLSAPAGFGWLASLADDPDRDHGG